MTKKISVLLLISILISVQFVYATPTDWAEEFVESMLLEELSSKEIIDSSHLQEAITREEFAELTVRLYAKAKGIEVGEVLQWNPFGDTNNKMVAKAYNIGIVSGTGLDSKNRKLFSPNNLVTRQEIAVMLIKELKILGIDVNVTQELNYSDTQSIASWAYDAVAFASESGILSGVGSNQVAPTAFATREQALTLLNKIGVKYGWIKNDLKTAKFNYSNSTTYDGFRIPNYQESELRAYRTETGIKYKLSHLVDAYRPDVKSQQNDMINILSNADRVSYNALVILREHILSGYDSVAKNFISSNTVYINLGSGLATSYAPDSNYIKVSTENEMILEYVK